MWSVHGPFEVYVTRIFADSKQLDLCISFIPLASTGHLRGHGQQDPREDEGARGEGGLGLVHRGADENRAQVEQAWYPKS